MTTTNKWRLLSVVWGVGDHQFRRVDRYEGSHRDDPKHVRGVLTYTERGHAPKCQAFV